MVIGPITEFEQIDFRTLDATKIQLRLRSEQNCMPYYVVEIIERQEKICLIAIVNKLTMLSPSVGIQCYFSSF